MMKYISIQKLRTPKGLGWLSSLPEGKDRNQRLLLLQRIQNIYCATWSDCIWLIADATKSPVKFIISDHPVTVYNRACFPGSEWCGGFNDPDIRMVGTHTYFPLSIEKILILTNLAWVRNPYQSERKVHPNPRLFRNTIFMFTDIRRIALCLNRKFLRLITSLRGELCVTLPGRNASGSFQRDTCLPPTGTSLARACF